MRIVKTIGSGLLVAYMVMYAIAAGAQPSARSQPGVPQTDQEKRGEALFLTSCPLCHVHSNQKRDLRIQANTDLVGLYKRPATNDASVRRVIVDGIPQLMPSFRHMLDTQQVDDLVAYLKIR